MIKKDSFVSMVTMENWMFQRSFEDFRKLILDMFTFSTFVHMPYEGRGRTSLGINFGTSAFVFRKGKPSNQLSYFMNIKYDEIDDDGTPLTFPVINSKHKIRSTSEFTKIPGSPIAYWSSNNIIKAFEAHASIDKYVVPRAGMITCGNDIFVRLWSEVNYDQLKTNAKSRSEAKESKRRWFPYQKGGDFRRWYGNNDYVVDWKDDGYSIRSRKDQRGKVLAHAFNEDYIFQPNINWSAVSSSVFSVRFTEFGSLFDATGSAAFPSGSNNLYKICSFLNSIVSQEFLKFIAPGLHFQSGHIGILPFRYDSSQESEYFSKTSIYLSKNDWDNFEISWDFQTHPLLRSSYTRIKEAFSEWDKTSSDAFDELKRLEEENNRYWIDAYGLQDELTPEVPKEQITIRKADLGRDVKSLLSYAVGCMMGRYSLDMPGLVHAGQPYDPSKHQKFPANADAILPVTGETYFSDDLVSGFHQFLKVAYSSEHLSENLEFIADALGRKGNEGAMQTIRRYFVTEFASDHIQTYKKRPIYWLFTSGKRKVFNAFVYLHRYTPDTIARLRTDYVLELQTRLDAELLRAEAEVLNASGPAKRAAEKRVNDLKLDIQELKVYQEKVQKFAEERIELDLDDGVAYNYTRFKGIVYEGADLKMADLEKKAQWKLDLLNAQEKQG